MPSATFDAIPTVNTCAIAAKMVQRVKAIKAKTGETANCCYKLAWLYTNSLIYLGEPHDLEYALRQAHDPGFDAMMTATAYRAQRKFCNEHLPEAIRPFTFPELQWLQHQQNM
jgi:hypothetical protein